ncbi:NAD(P)-dependent oxidoreductase [Methanobacterium formicicum]|jgi:3-hydroxyisobutyrate dehydrogenase-like beta-hydroxyacid dehydrogenase|uniref:Phosphogluconate dehydrogenase, NAD-binding protein n=1 Tax=Methanobacterium formicicum TaxID=2162 RepID=A0A0S4FQR3_METFO|nr:NAD(P)-dependent oxidoreductase [Methanobacterium formicicum]CEL25435.1 phosphogluconate dehydrogenase, NAD-binding protein [Methanobacterium formicicum]
MVRKNQIKLGFLGFGEVASTLSEGLLAHGVEVSTCLEGRSQRSMELAKSSGVGLFDSLTELSESSDILLSAVVPAEAVIVAAEVGGGDFDGVYVDLNNVSPGTVKEAFSHITNGKTVDGAIMGGIKNGLGTPIIASGEFAEDFAELNQYGMNIEVIGPEPGQASGLKMLRSAYTKGVSALLFETLYPAYKMGVDEVLLRYLSQTEGSHFKEASISRLKSSALHAQRRAQEMSEVHQFLSQYEDPVITPATREFFHNLLDKIGQIPEKPADYWEIFDKIDEKDDQKARLSKGRNK